MEAAVAGRLVWCCTHCGAMYRSDFPRCPNDGAEVLASKRDPLVGTTLKHYAIEALIGEGAMGRVYRASHRHLPTKLYAVKVLIGDLAVTASNRLRFAKEAESASKLSHPNVVDVIDFGRTEKGLLYIAMELVDGEPASAILDRAPMDPARVVRLARGVCEGLAHAHAAGIVHRDLKPDNILVMQTPDGEIGRIVDFGLAISTAGDDARLTTTGMTMGTPAYIAPEQASGKPIDHRVDLYALGVSMFEMLTGGKLPFDADDPVAMVTAKIMRDPSTLEQCARELRVPPGVSQVVAKLLKRLPADRYATAADVIAALDRVQLRPSRARIYHRAAATVALVAMLGAGVWAAATDTRTSAGVAPAPLSFGAPANPGAGPANPGAGPNNPGAGPANPGAGPNNPGAGPANDGGKDAATSRASASSGDAAKDKTDGSAARTPSDAIAAVPTRPSRQPTKPRSHAGKSSRAAAVTRQPPDDPTPVALASGAPTSGATTSAPPTSSAAPPTGDASTPAPPPPKTRIATIAAIDVSGPLSQSDVRRAVDRVVPALRGCTITGDAATLAVFFTIGENRRPEDLRATGGGSAAARCVIGALSSIRTEAAPDVGSSAVAIKVAFP